MKLVFCGTPAFAVPSLRALLAAGHEIAMVVTQPDRAAGRGMELQLSPVKQLALEHRLPVAQPETIKHNVEFRTQVGQTKPDAIAVIAYGRIIPQWMLDLPRLGNVNVHGSLLPKYRGAAPVQWAVAHGERVTGVTTMLLDAGLDTGPMLQAHELAVPPYALASDLLPVLAEVGAALLVETLRGLEEGSLRPIAQDHSVATTAPILTREDGRIEFTRPAQDTYNRWRGFYPWPGAHTSFRGKKLIVHRMAVATLNDLQEPIEGLHSGEIAVAGERLLVVCGGMGVLALEEVQMEGKRRMSAAEFLRGYQVKDGERLG